MKRLFSGTREDILKENLEKTKKARELLLRELQKHLKPNNKRQREKELRQVDEEVDKIDREIRELAEQSKQNYISMPKNCFLNNKDKYSLIGVGSDGRKYWKDSEGQYYSWDNLHGEVEYYNHRKKHLGSLQCIDRGQPLKPAVKGRKAHI